MCCGGGEGRWELERRARTEADGREPACAGHSSKDVEPTESAVRPWEGLWEVRLEVERRPEKHLAWFAHPLAFLDFLYHFPQSVVKV